MKTLNFFFFTYMVGKLWRESGFFFSVYNLDEIKVRFEKWQILIKWVALSPQELFEMY